MIHYCDTSEYCSLYIHSGHCVHKDEQNYIIIINSSVNLRPIYVVLNIHDFFMAVQLLWEQVIVEVEFSRQHTQY